MLLDLRVQCVSLWLGVACHTDATWGFGWFQASSGLAKSRKASDSKLDYSDITVLPSAPRPRQFLYFGTILSHHVDLKLCSCTQLAVLAYRALAGVFMHDSDSLNLHLLEVVHLKWTSWRADHVLVA
jgi:hypothetical protein